VKVGHRQAITARNAQSSDWAFSLELLPSSKENAGIDAHIHH
jgi:hypothetical protein